jgi:leucyl aminopeptidase (aminopeptidase T)
MDELQQAVEAVVGRCLGVAPGERVVVVAETGPPAPRAIGDALHEAASSAGAKAVMTLMDPRAVGGQEPPDAVAAALSACDVFIAPTTASISHTRARKAATENGARGATLPGVTEDMLGRLMSADLQAIKRGSDAVADLLTRDGSAHVSCPRGSDFTLDLTGRSGHSDDGHLTGPQAFGNLPCGEGYIAPLNGGGRLIFASFAGIGLSSDRNEVTVENGRLTSARGPEAERLKATLEAAGELGTNLAELGVGTNERAGLTGLVLEDEKMLGTVHVAFGASMAIGGTVSVPVHLDSVVLEPTLEIGGTRVIEGGRFLL